MEASGQIHAPAALTQGKRRQLGESHSRSVNVREEENFLPYPGFEPVTYSRY
jgi:hypothetical protein